MKTYTVKNKQHEQDNINFIDMTNPKEEMPSFLDYEEVLTYSLDNGLITSEENIQSLCDGGDHTQAYFSESNAAYECKTYLENTPFQAENHAGEWEDQTLWFHPEIYEYELY